MCEYDLWSLRPYSGASSCTKVESRDKQLETCARTASLVTMSHDEGHDLAGR